MHGNVWEWCQDWHGAYESLQVVSDPTGAESGSRRVLRGGSFNFQPERVRSAYRDNYGARPGGLSVAFGFRLARTYNLSP